MRQAAQSLASPAFENGGAAPGHKPIDVLLIEDNPGDALLIEEMLSDARQIELETAFRVLVTEQLSAAREALARQPVDVVLLDVSLPDGNGLDLLKDASRQTLPPVIILTGTDDERLGMRAVEQGAQDYLVKDRTDSSMLVRVIRYAIERQRMVRELDEKARQWRASETRFRHLVEKNADGVIVLDKDGVVRFANPAAEKLFGRDASQLIGRVFGTPEVRGGGAEIEIIGKGLQLAVVMMRVVETVWAGEEVYLASLRDETARRQAENALRDSEELFRQLFEQAPIAYHEIDRDGIVRRVNRAECELLGYRTEEILGRPIWEFAAPEIRPVVQDAIRAKMTPAHRSVPFQREYVRRDGTRLILEVHENLILDAQGQVIGIRSALLDVTERHLAMQEIRKLNQDLGSRKSELEAANLRLHIGNRILNILLTSSDEDMYRNVLGIILDVSKSECGFIGYIDEQGALVWPSMLPDLRNLAGKQGSLPREKWGGLWGRVLLERRTLYKNEPHQYPEGHFPLVRSLGTPIVDQGELIGSVQVANKQSDYDERDVGLLESIAAMIAPVMNARLQRDRQERERRKAEQALRASEERYRDLFENANDVIYTADLEGWLTSWNKAGERISGYSAVDVSAGNVRRNIHDIIAPEFRAVVHEAIQRKFQGEPVTTYELEIIAKDGRRVPLEVSSRLIYEGGRPVGLQGIARDVTERKRLQEQLQQAQKMEAVGRLAGGVAHDFNNLLMVIGGYSELLLERLAPDDPSRRDAEQIRKAGERAASLTRQLLVFSRKQVLLPRILDLNAAVANINAMLRRLIGEDIELSVSLSPDLDSVKADPGQIEQILMNLAVNARDAMPQGGKLTISTANVDLDENYARRHSGVNPGRYAMLAVTDNGAGMDAETQAHIFEPFFTTKARGKGTGLGLATVYGIVQQSEGHIFVYSEVGRGTSFKIYFPRHGEAVEFQPAKAEVATMRGTETILLAEDERIVRELVRDELCKRGYTVLEAGQPDEVLRLVQRHKGPIDLLITDVVMPGMSGRRLAEEILTVRPNTKVLYMSGYTDDAIVSHGVLEAGIAFLQKPFTGENLNRKVREVLEQNAASFEAGVKA